MNFVDHNQSPAKLEDIPQKQCNKKNSDAKFES